MKTMTLSQWEKAAHFMSTEARLLERALFAHEFKGESREAVVAELAAYRNEDGGFGRGLEPDIRCAASTPYATTVALQLLVRLDADGQEPLVRSAMRYLAETADAGTLHWPSVNAAVNAAPHAPWWHVSDPDAKPAAWTPNPSAEIAGYFHRYAALVPADLRERLTAAALDNLARQPDRMDMHDIQCFLRMAELTGDRNAQERLVRCARETAEANPAAWEGYGLQPVTAAPSPQSPYAAAFPAETLERNVDFVLDKQLGDGSWGPPWAWGQYDDVWPIAEREWKGVLTLERIRLLREYGRLPESALR